MPPMDDGSHFIDMFGVIDASFYRAQTLDSGFYRCVPMDDGPDFIDIMCLIDATYG